MSHSNEFLQILERIVDYEGEPRIRDLDLAEKLNYERPRDIRQLIQRKIVQLEEKGICVTVQQIHEGAGRPGTEYLLNEAQAVLVCMWSETDIAAQVQSIIVDVFVAWRRNRLAIVPSTEIVLLTKIVGRVDAMDSKLEAIDGKVERIDGRLVKLEDGQKQITEHLKTKRTQVSDPDKKSHRLFVRRIYFGRCPMCRSIEVVDAAYELAPGAEFEHFYARYRSRFEETWILCHDCHLQKTTRKRPKADFQTAFDEYQRLANDNGFGSSGDILPKASPSQGRLY